MRLNDLSPAPGAKRERRRVGRGASAGQGKTCGRGHKGQKSRAGGKVPRGFEGGQMPMHRRLPKFGFTSRTARFVDEVRLDALARIDAEVVDLDALKAAKAVSHRVRKVKIIASGKLVKAVQVKGLLVTKGARAAIESAGGSVE